MRHLSNFASDAAVYHSIGRAAGTLTAPESPSRQACDHGKRLYCESPGVHLGCKYASLIFEAKYLMLLPVTYRFSNRGQPASVPVFMRGLDLLSALYASQRLPLPLRGVLLVGY
jgi:hypothetical protein